MFSCNGCISERQMIRMVVLPLYASLVFVLPHLCARQFGTDFLWGLLLFAGMTFVYGFLLNQLMKWNEKIGEPQPSRWIAALYLMRIWIRIGFYICLISTMLSEGDGPFKTSLDGGWIIRALPFAGICIYGAMLRLEQQGRLYEILFWLLFIPFVFVLVFGVASFNPEILNVERRMEFPLLVKKCYPLLAFVLPMEYVLFLQPKLSQKEKKCGSWFGIGKTVLLSILLSVLMLGIFGVNGAAKETMLTVEILRCIRLPFRLTERVDALLVWFFLVGCFVLLSQSLFFAGQMIQRICPKVKPVWGMIYLLVKGFLLMLCVRKYEDALAAYCVFAMLVDIPLSLLLPLINGLLHSGGKKKKRILAGMWISVLLLLSGCGKATTNSMKNIEEQDYATILLMEPKEQEYKILLGVARERKVGEQSMVERFTSWEAKDFDELRKQYGLVMGKSLSLAHLKAVLLPAPVPKSAIKMLGEDREFAKTCPVLLWRDTTFLNTFWRYGQEAQAPVGIYVQNIMEKSRQEGVLIPWLLDYEKWLRADGREKICYIKKVSKGYEIEPFYE